MSPILSISHYKSKAVAINDADPDDGNDWRCEACLLPIFSTPFVVNQPDGGRMHDQCANKIPERLEDHPLHPKSSLVRQNLIDRGTHCFRCKSKCGAMSYVCPDTFYCEGFTLDLACALEIKIIHQSHKHELTATMSSSCSFICSACGTQHDRPKRGEWGVSYVCSPCDFWLHPDCAVLPNAIIEFDDDDKAVVHHDHPLLLTYGNSADELWRLLRPVWIWDADRSDYKCAICGGRGDDYKGLGWYRCFHCKYSVHINCIVYSHPPQRFKPVLLRDAKVPGLIHLPMANQHQTVIQRIMNSTAGTIDCASTINSKVHQHLLVINQPLLRNNNNNDDDDDDDDRVCNACVQLISPSEAFYSCCKVINSCRDFFLHSCCAQLPDEITTPKCNMFIGQIDHTLSLLVSGEVVGNKFPFLRSVMGGKIIRERRLHNGFAYWCKVCDKYIDVINALMPASITHDAHAKSHILCITYQYGTDLICSCCKINYKYDIQIGYECNNCNNFYIHMDCALLPDKVSHDFDRHPLKLITTSTTLREQGEEEELPLCEICEQDMVDKEAGRPWFYGCKECDNSFHVDCMPYFDDLSGIKFGFTIRVKGHSCPLACVRALSVEGYRCAHCHDVIRESENSIKSKIAFECAECDYRIHGSERCAWEQQLLNG